MTYLTVDFLYLHKIRRFIVSHHKNASMRQTRHIECCALKPGIDHPGIVRYQAKKGTLYLPAYPREDLFF